MLWPGKRDPTVESQPPSEVGEVRLGRAEGGFEDPKEVDGLGYGLWVVARLDHDEYDDLVSFYGFCETDGWCPTVVRMLVSSPWSSP
jgi:hypothetical protein